MKTLISSAAVMTLAAPLAMAAPASWSIVTDQPGATTTRSMRGLAINADASVAYTTFLQGSSTASVRSYDLAGDPPVGTQAANVNISGWTGSGAATNTQAEANVMDSTGLLFSAIIKESTSHNNSKIAVFSPDMSSSSLINLTKITAGDTSETIGGIDFRQSGADRQLYVSRFRSNTAYLERYVIGGSDVATTTLTLDTTFNGSGVLNVASLIGGATQLRGIDVAADGTIFIASRENNSVYKISSDLSAGSSTSVTGAMDIALFGDDVYVSQYAGSNSAITVLDMTTLGLVESFVPSFARGPDGGYAGIDFDADGRLFVVDQFYGGTSASLSDRILVSAPIPEPAALSLIALGGFALLGRRRA